MNHLFDDIAHPITGIKPPDGVEQYQIHSIKVEYDTTRVDDTIGWVPYGEGEVFHPGGGIKAVPDEKSIVILELVFGDWDEVHYFHWKDGKFKAKPEVMPITDEQFKLIHQQAIDYAQDNIEEIEIEPWYPE